MTNSGNNFQLNSDGEFLESFNLNFDTELSKIEIFERSLVPTSDFNHVKSFLLEHMGAIQHNDKTLKIVKVEGNNEKTELYLDTEAQSIVLIKDFDASGKILSQRSFYYEISGNLAILKSEIFETFEKSVVSDLSFKAVSITEYFKK